MNIYEPYILVLDKEPCKIEVLKWSKWLIIIIIIIIIIITNYLDITLDLNDGSYRPYRKPNEETKYIHISSDHQPSIIKEIPRSIEKDPKLSSKDIFQESAIYY